MFRDLIGILSAHHGGDDSPMHRPLPPSHLQQQTWKFNCGGCGYIWKWRGDAVWRAGAWRAPVSECLQCHAWVEGYRLDGV